MEVTLKDDAKGDPLITEDALIALNVMTEEEYRTCKKMTQELTWLIDDELFDRGLNLWDIKFEFGSDESREIILMDEISGGNMRVFDDNGAKIGPIELADRMVPEIEME